MNKLKIYLGYFFIGLAVIFLFLHSLRTSDGTTVYNIWGLEVPQQPTWTFFIPQLTIIGRFVFEMTSLHGLIGVVVFLPLLSLGILLSERDKDKEREIKNNKSVLSRDQHIEKVKKGLSRFSLFIILWSVLEIAFNPVLVRVLVGGYYPSYFLIMMFVFLIFIPLIIFSMKLRKTTIEEHQRITNILLFVIFIAIIMSVLSAITGMYPLFQVFAILLALKCLRGINFLKRGFETKNVFIDTILTVLLVTNSIYAIYWGISLFLW